MGKFISEAVQISIVQLGKMEKIVIIIVLNATTLVEQRICMYSKLENKLGLEMEKTGPKKLFVYNRGDTMYY